MNKNLWLKQKSWLKISNQDKRTNSDHSKLFTRENNDDQLKICSKRSKSMRSVFEYQQLSITQNFNGKVYKQIFFRCNDKERLPAFFSRNQLRHLDFCNFRTDVNGQFVEMKWARNTLNFILLIKTKLVKTCR